MSCLTFRFHSPSFLRRRPADGSEKRAIKIILTLRFQLRKSFSFQNITQRWFTNNMLLWYLSGFRKFLTQHLRARDHSDSLLREIDFFQQVFIAFCAYLEWERKKRSKLINFTQTQLWRRWWWLKSSGCCDLSGILRILLKSLCFEWFPSRRRMKSA